jgi:hypothetical protein
MPKSLPPLEMSTPVCCEPIAAGVIDADCC